MKTCIKCGETKIMREFYYKDKQDAYDSACKPCARARTRAAKDRRMAKFNPPPTPELLALRFPLSTMADQYAEAKKRAEH